MHSLMLMVLLVSAPPQKTPAAGKAPAPAANTRCREAYATMGRELNIQEFFDGAAKKGWTGASDKISAYFEQACVTLPPDALDCVKTAKGKEMRQCKAAMETLGKAMARYGEEKDPGGFERYQFKSMQIEAKVQLRSVKSAAQYLLEDVKDPSKFKFPASVGPSPAADCCATPEKACTDVAKDFAHPSWQALMFKPEGKVRYHYTLTTAGAGNTATITVRAEGDPQCKGAKDVWEITGKLENGALVMGDPVNLTPPKEPAPAAAPPK